MDEGPRRPQPTRSARRYRSNVTRARIMAAAEEVFARDGVATGSMAAILRASGQRNEAAIAYHFGSREGLALAIIEARRVPFSEHRLEMLERATAGGRIPSIHEALEAIIQPSVVALASHEGRNYLRILADVFRRLSVADRQRPRAADARQAIRLLEARLVHQPEEIVTERITFAVSAIVEALGQRATDLERPSEPFLDAWTWERNLVLMLEAVLTAPLPGPTANEPAGPV
jgi:AcrR family transcriptional regulator